MKNLTTKELTLIPMFSIIFAISAWITVPIGPVPFTMQTFAIFLAAFILGGRLSAYSLIIYLFLGAIGLPVFSGFSGGLGVLIGPTGGYLFGYIISCLAIGISFKLWGDKTLFTIVSSIVGLLLCYTLGTIWFILVYTQTNETISVVAALSLTVFPFVIPDLVKIALALGISKKIKPFLSVRNNAKVTKGEVK